MPLPLIGKVAIGVALATVVVMKDGLIEVNVQEHHKGGDHVHLYVPATVATWGVHLAPEEKLREHLQSHREDLGVARAVLIGLEKLPDASLVQVDSPKEHVNVQLRNGNLVVDVEDPGETVHVSMPVRAARKVVEDLETDAPTT